MEEPVIQGMAETRISDHPNPLKRVGLDDHTPCPNCGCRLSLERIRNEIMLTKQLNEMRARARERARRLAREAAQGPPTPSGVLQVTGTGGIRAMDPIHTINFGVGMRVTGHDVADKSYMDNEPTVTLTSRTCSECGVRYEPEFANDRENLLEELAKARMEGMSAIDLLGDLVGNDEG